MPLLRLAPVRATRPFAYQSRSLLLVNGQKYYIDEFVYVANEATIEQQRATGRNANSPRVLKSSDFWVARILEIRALDEHHVYARIYWMYSPDELPPGTQDNKKTISGRQPYHGANELIASNHSKTHLIANMHASKQR
jgi:hypothetical protein